jgi:predicted nucleic acid-binding protein
LLSKRTSHAAARTFLKTTVSGEREVAYLAAGLLQRAVELNNQYADLNLGLTDAFVMAIAERHELPILTFDFKDFRATESAAGPWRLAIDEATYMKFCGAL